MELIDPEQHCFLTRADFGGDQQRVESIRPLSHILNDELLAKVNAVIPIKGVRGCIPVVPVGGNTTSASKS